MTRYAQDERSETTMPSGYTSIIGEGGTFEEFAWGCARAFGALVMMRDEPHDAQVPDEFQPSAFYKDRIEEARAGLARMEAMSDDEAARAAAEERREALAGNARREAEKEELAAKYRAMLDRVHAWVPPSEDHEGMKEFMIEQITRSMEFDCHAWQQELPDADGRRWRRDKMIGLKKDLARAHQEWGKELERTAGRNRWVRQLRGSIPQPTTAAEAPTPGGSP